MLAETRASLVRSVDARINVMVSAEPLIRFGTAE